MSESGNLSFASYYGALSGNGLIPIDLILGVLRSKEASLLL